MKTLVLAVVFLIGSSAFADWFTYRENFIGLGVTCEAAKTDVKNQIVKRITDLEKVGRYSLISDQFIERYPIKDKIINANCKTDGGYGEKVIVTGTLIYFDRNNK